ncbi:MAG TPA: mannose-1-phosphate guanylyltransferase [Thermotogota bacterium]|nr:mannose-1-phosphate guanylyltransferase [Thermotogota bacterium]HRW92033.1 mannose-1-phosphate guanylyltransferase [Thermotogota bacterium]
MKCIILAGGTGERFWPLSTPTTPKQFLKLFGEKTLLRMTFERVLPQVPAENILVVTSHTFLEMTHRELPEVPLENLVGEPQKRNTAPACLVGTLLCSSGEPVLVLPADHFIPDVEHFHEAIAFGEKIACSVPGLFTFGIRPTRPETGYGYIEEGEKLVPGVSRVHAFHEKPSKEKAIQFLNQNRFFWNSGMFLWERDFFLDQFETYCPHIFRALHDVDPRDPEQMRAAYEKLEPLSIDYALMEKSPALKMFSASFSWSDVGNWKSLQELQGYTSPGKNRVLLNSKHVYIHAPDEKNIAVVGLDDVFVIESEHGLLVVHSSALQRVRDVVKQISTHD